MKFDGTAANGNPGEPLTIEKVIAAAQIIKSLPPVPRLPRLLASALCENVPRMTLSAEVPVTPQFRADMNAWMRRFFGVQDIAYEFNDPLTGERVIVTSRRNVESIEIVPVDQEPQQG